MDIKEYNREYHRNRSPEAKAKKIRLQLERKASIRHKVDDYKSKHPCPCGENHPACLDLHHNSEEKDLCVSDAIKHGWSFDRIKTEMDKCVVLCSNCHRKIHWTK